MFFVVLFLLPLFSIYSQFSSVISIIFLFCFTCFYHSIHTDLFFSFLHAVIIFQRRRISYFFSAFVFYLFNSDSIFFPSLSMICSSVVLFIWFRDMCAFFSFLNSFVRFAWFCLPLKLWFCDWCMTFIVRNTYALAIQKRYQ